MTVLTDNFVVITIQHYTTITNCREISINKHKVKNPDSIEIELESLIRSLNFFNEDYHPIQIQVDFNPDKSDSHFIYMIGYSRESGEVFFSDPGDGVNVVDKKVIGFSRIN